MFPAIGGGGRLARGRGGLPSGAYPLSLPHLPTEIKETEKDYQLCVDVPGIKKEDLKVEVDKDVIHVSGQRHEEKETDENLSGVVYHTKEVSRGSFSRSFQLPEDADLDKIDCVSAENGVLKLVVPKHHEQHKQKKQVPIK